MEKRDIVDDCRVTRYRRNEFKIKKKNSILHKFDISISFVVLHDIIWAALWLCTQKLNDLPEKIRSMSIFEQFQASLSSLSLTNTFCNLVLDKYRFIITCACVY